MLLEFYPIVYDYTNVSGNFNNVYWGAGTIYGKLEVVNTGIS